MLLIVSILVYLITALPLTVLVFDSFRFSRWMITFFLTAFTINVLSAELLGLFHLLNRAWLFFLVQFLICTGVVVFLWRHKKPDIVEIKKQIRENRKQFHLTDGILLAVIVIITGSLLVIGFVTPPNNLDSLHTHLPRIYYWLQHGSFAPWAATYLPQLVYPVDAHIQGAWLFLLSRQENTFFLVQWSAMVIVICTVFEIALLLGFNRRQAWAAAMTGLAFPAVLLQAYSFQGDLTVAALILICILFLFQFRKNNRMAALVTAMLPLMLALGTKQTAFFFLPAAGLLLLYWFLTRYISRKQILTWIGCSLIFFAALSSPQYIRNLQTTHSLLGEEIIRRDDQPAGENHFSEKVLYNAGRFLYQFISFEGIPERYALPMQAYKAGIFEHITGWLRMDLEAERYLPPGYDSSEAFQYAAFPFISEDTSWYGPLSFLLLPAALIAAAFRKDSLVHQYLVFVLIFLGTYLLILLWQRPGWDPYQGRYFFIALAPLLPLTAGLIPAKKLPSILLPVLLSAVVLVLGVYTVFFNHSKPIITRGLGYSLMVDKVLNLPNTTRLERGFRFLSYTVVEAISEMETSVDRYSMTQIDYQDQLLFNDASLVEDLLWIEGIVPADADLTISIHKSPLEYALFGRNKARNLYPIDPSEPVTVVPGYYLIEKREGDPLLGLGIEQLGENDRFVIYRQ